ncbi:kinase non-catalytic C-lobe domain-containing protein 1 isoform X2 [Anguilla anguilla]|uniref:kinase non-catalytic C-lobe domain-containing protein 1 isoform X2 n=1 Tax=Anguilla anguilla TaxID=7936 RepID=UPI0015B11BF3|nr:kinase non-catalytic C-lobe domain-containing protein 1 isoform X2 [Anguilla anguilla]
MGTSETAMSAYYEEEEEEEDELCEFEPLPALLEDEENVSLADVLSLRDSCLSEPEVWAVCLECVLALQSIDHSPLFHMLCITPDTLAFNAHGNVCFMEQLSDDPEGSFMPPEFDRTGNTFEGHIYSLGSTLAAALDFVIEPELEPDLGLEVRRLLDQMQQKNPLDRPSVQDIATLAAGHLERSSSMSVCRKLSAIGRRVLSIESLGAFHDDLPDSWAAHERGQMVRWAAVNGLRDPEDSGPAAGKRALRSRDASPCTDAAAGGAEEPSRREAAPFEPCLNSRSQDSSPVRRALGRAGRTRGALDRSSSVPDSNNPPTPPPLHVCMNAPLADLTEIGAEESSVDGVARNGGLHNGVRDLAARHHDPDTGVCSASGEHAGTWQVSPSSLLGHCELGPEVSARDGVTNHKDCPVSQGDEAPRSNGVHRPSNHMTKSMLCLNEETQDEWISLRELLSHYCRPLSVNELWALCYTCLSTLQTYIDFPAYLCLDSLYIGCEGEVLFLSPKNTGPCDPFYLAPEYQEHGIVTEKACIYGVAAILWATAKFGLSPNQKLAMPRKLKRLLLEMAKRIPIERPSIIVAKKCCRDYLSHQGVSAEVVWAKLIHRARQAHHRDCDTENSLDNMKMEEESSQIKLGFVPCAGENGLSPVQGPVPHRYHDSHLPEAFTSPATHFTPIILTRDGATEGEGGAWDSVEEGSWCEKESPGGEQEVLLNIDDSLVKGAKTREDEPQHTITQGTGASWDCSSTSSSGETLVNSLSPPSTTHVHTHQETSSPPLQSGPTSSCPSSNQHTGSFGSFLLRQDPRTGLLTLFPVQISVPAPIPGLDLGLGLGLDMGLASPFSTSLPGQERQAAGQNGSLRTAAVPTSPGGHVNRAPPAPSPLPGGSRGNQGPAQAGHLGTEGGTEKGTEAGKEVGTPRVSSQAPLAQSPRMHPCLQAVIILVREEFAFQGYLENGVEDRAMGEYIFSLRNLQYETFCSAVSEKYPDLYWDEKLLDALYHVINKAETTLSPRDPSCMQSSSTRPPSNGQQRAARSAGRERRPRGDVGARSRDELEPGLPEPKGGGEAPPGPLHPRAEDGPLGPGTQVCGSTEGPPAPAPKITCLSEAQNTDAPEEPRLHGRPEPIPKEMTEGGCLKTDFVECPAEGAVEASHTESPLHAGVGERCLGRGQLSLDYSEDIEDTDSLASMGGLQEEGRPLGAEGCRCVQDWALSFYGEECFKEDVLRYAKKLGQGSKAPCLEAKLQELHQQLMIETRNLKKTRNFYNKLLHQERRNKGSDAKIMILKIKVQLEEMKTKVDFLDSVRKYLEVLCMDQWGLEVALLRSLAVSGTTPLELHPSEDPSILTFQPGSGRGRGSPGGTASLQAGTPLGLMSYLYARNAPLEGYIQQFLYTYRYFCTPEDFLRFLKDRFISVAGDSQAPSAERSKVLHRTLDLLQAWLENSRQVDFPPKSSLYQTLEEFLISQVIPVEGRGEALLTLLQSPPRKRRSHMVSRCCGSPISIQEEDDTQTVHSIEDSGRKSFQWRTSRVVEPQSAQPKEKPFSIAAALPRPCYSSLLDELSGPSLRTEDRYPFYQSEHRAQHAANQLTLLQQEIFQGCHPVHFLNSRAQGVRDKAASKSLSPDLPPIEGSSLFASDTMLQDRYLPQMLKHADNVATWVSAEIVICDSLKTQASLLTKFLLMAKCSYESRDFASAIQILGGLENVIVKQLPAWRHLSAKAWQILEELRTVQVFLKSDNLCLMEGERFKRKPTIPAAHILAMHIQQLEIGAFTLANGAYKWPKLRNIAKVVSQVHAFQENVFPHAPDLELQAYLRHRIALLSHSDIALLAAENDANFHQMPAERHSKRIQDTLRRVKATFQ